MHAENNVNFHCGISAALKLCYKIAFVTLESLANEPVFLGKQYVHTHAMGCKRGYTLILHCQSDLDLYNLVKAMSEKP